MGLQDKIAGEAVTIVVRAFQEVTGQRFFKPRMGVATEQSCREFVRLSFLLTRSVLQLMHEAVGLYGRAWCQETFDRPFPPFQVVIGEKCRKRLIANHRPKVLQTPEGLAIQAKEIAVNLHNLMGSAGALETVSAGWPVEDKLRAAVFAALKEIVKK